MKKRVLLIMAVVLAAALLAGCGKKGQNTGAEPSPTPGKQAVVMTAPPETETPAGQTYGSMENLLSITLPDGTWIRQEDTYNKMRFQSAGRGDIHVLQASVWDEGGVKMPEAASGVRDLLKAVNYVGAYETVSFTKGSAVWVDTFEAELTLTPADVSTQYKTCVMYGVQNDESVVIAVGMIVSEDQKDKDTLMASLKTLSKGTEEEISALQTSSSAGYQNGNGSSSRDNSNDSQDNGNDSQSGQGNNESGSGYDGGDGSDSREETGGNSDGSYTGDDGSGSDEDGSGEYDDSGDGGSDEGSGDSGSSDDSSGEEGSSGEDGSYDGAGEDENYE